MGHLLLKEVAAPCQKRITSGQRISAELYTRARELRQDMTPAEGLLCQYLRAGRLQGCHFRRQPVMHFYRESYKVR
jgi:very-short-patch-repair endonuclease